jgi:hypothetical protein
MGVSMANNSLRLAFSNPREPRRNQSKTAVMSPNSISAKSDAIATIIAVPNRRRAGIRAHHAIAVAVAILLGFGAKLFFFPAPPAEGDSASSAMKSASADVYQKHQNIKNLPVQKFRDMSLVFSD